MCTLIYVEVTLNHEIGDQGSNPAASFEAICGAPLRLISSVVGAVSDLQTTSPRGSPRLMSSFLIMVVYVSYHVCSVYSIRYSSVGDNLTETVFISSCPHSS